MGNRKKKKKFEFPSAFTVLFIVLILVVVLTYIVPAGAYERLSYVEDGTFIVEDQSGEQSVMPASQETLDDMNVIMDLEKFEDGSINKPVAIPGTYESIEQQPQGILDFIMAPVDGVLDTVDIMVFVLILGGIIGLINKTGTFDAGISALSKKTQGKQFLLVIVVATLTAIGGSTFGLAEETIALYPILLPIFLSAGYDAIIGIAAIYLGAAIGAMFSTVNPFSIVIASDAAGISFKEGLTFRIIGLVLATAIVLIYIYRYARKVKKDPKNSIIYEAKDRIDNKFLEGYDPDNVVKFNWQRVLMLVVFLGAFPIMVWGVASQDWWFGEMAGLFLAVALIIIFLSGLGEKEAVATFLNGAADLIGVVLIIGVARGINIIMDNGMISDTLLFYASGIIENMNKGIFAVVQMILFSILGFFIPSSSGLATLSMPIMAPLADTVNVSRAIVVTAYNWGHGLMQFITPTGLILATLEMVDVTYDKWLKFVLPLMGIIAVFAAIMLGINTLLF
ncbi:MAG: YfcC family protein [Tissierella sp.]|uniref:YfcC family protein n=1 Tax=Tissierella sp. TaxID=41274 RepID=UPI003F969478